MHYLKKKRGTLKGAEEEGMNPLKSLRVDHIKIGHPCGEGGGERSWVLAETISL